MPKQTDDSQREFLADDQVRYLWNRVPAQGWFKPDEVTLSRRLWGNILEYQSGKRSVPIAGLVPTGQLKFIQDPHWLVSSPRTNPVRPHPDIFDRFLELHRADDHQIREFASQYGALLVFGKIALSKIPNKFVIIESCDVWRYLAASMRCLLRIAGCFHTRRRPDPADWAPIGGCPASLVPSKRLPLDLLSPYSHGPEEEWIAMAGFVGRGTDRDRKMWTRLLNTLLELGKVRAWLRWRGPAPTARPDLVFTGPNLLSYLALQLCLRAAKHDAFDVCSYCHREYAPARAPKMGQRNFCPDCRAKGIPVRMAQRSRRDRLRADRKV